MNTSPDQYGLLSTLLGAINSGTEVTRSLERLIEQKISIPKGARERASESQNHIREFLRAEARRDASFPPILTNVDSDFLGGSFARHTKIWPLDDIDIYFPLDGTNLYYVSPAGARLPYTVLSDEWQFGNRLLLPRWTYGTYVSSAKLVTEFAKVLQRHNPRTQVSLNGESVSIRMTLGETEEADGLGYDIVPCFSMKPDNKNEFEFYLIPDGRNAWIRTNPRLDADLSEILQRFHNGLYRKVVKLIKYWNADRLNGAFSSYYIELTLLRSFYTRKLNNQPTSSLSEGLEFGFATLQKAFQAGKQESWISEAPPVLAPTLSLSQLVTMSGAQENATRARALEQNGHGIGAVNRWSDVFGIDLR